MQRKTPKLLSDICDAAAFISQVTAGKTLEEYQRDRQLRQAVERNFEIIGEAVNRLSRIEPAVAEKISSSSQIIAFRNLFIHGYDLIDDTQVWHVIIGSLPTLLSEVHALLGSSG